MSLIPKNIKIAMTLLCTVLITGCYTTYYGYNPYRYTPTPSQGEQIGTLTANPHLQNSTSNPYGAGSKYNPNSVNNPYGKYVSKYSTMSARNPYATTAPKLYDQDGNYRGKLSSNPYDPDSISNPYGRYGSKYSPDSINNPYGAGNPYAPRRLTHFMLSGVEAFCFYSNYETLRLRSG